MKRIKLLLAATAVVAVVGGALAFKAVKNTELCLYTSTASGTCDFLTTTFSITNSAGGSNPFRKTIVKDGDCPSTATCSQRAVLAVEPN